MQHNSILISAATKTAIDDRVDAVAHWRRREGALKHRGHRTVRRNS